MHVPSRLCLFVLAWQIGAPTTGSAGTDATPGSAALHLVNEGYVAGALKPSPRGMLRWQGDAFTTPFAFPQKSVRRDSLATAREVAAARG